ncbi:MAG TPA: hypothetical protein VN711_04055 [Candidatus Saccharimonadales bacterium]|nr:hypothetical protein [Candidatus Saccharimonadales bacterium]
MKKHLGYYVSFLLILAGGVFLVYQSQGDKMLQLDFVILLSLAYVVWGLLHHFVHHSMSIKVVIEYIVVALLGIAVVFFVINGGL